MDMGSAERPEKRNPMNASDLKWTTTCEAGEYLCEYDDTDDEGDDLYPEPDSGSRCGRDDQELDEINSMLSRRGLTLEADDRGLVAVAV